MDSNSKYLNNIAVLLISHGSSLNHASKTFDEISHLFKESTGFNTEVGYMKVAEPSLSQAIDNLLAKNKNINKIIAMPVFLSPGIHTNIDIPLILGLNPKESDPRCPDGIYPEGHYLSDLTPINFNGTIELLDPIGPDSLIIDIINKRVSSALEKSKLNSNMDKTAILLISHGSRLNYNREFITAVFKQYNSNNDYIVGYAFMELMEPTIPEAVKDLVKNNDIERLIAVPVFIAHGVHTTRDIPTILGLIENDEDLHNHSHHHIGSDKSHSHNHEKIDFDGEVVYVDPLGADSLIIKIIKNRIEEVLK